MKQMISIRMLSPILVVLIFLSGCAVQVPLKVDPAADMQRAFGNKKKMPIKVGLYIDEDTKKYIYKQQKMGMTFFMQVGGFLHSISKEMSEQMFEEVVYVNSLPPYDDSYRPDVEAVVVPELLYCFGDAIGTVSGYIQVNVVTQVTAYDLSGKVVWKNRTTGSQKSGQKDFVASFLGGMADVGEIGYQAAFNGAVQIINNFHTSPPEKLIDLLEVKKVASVRNHSDDNMKFKNLYEKGESNFQKKNYHQALYSFMQASKYETIETPPTAFFIGTCYAYLGDKGKALEYFEKVIKNNPSSAEEKQSQQWVQKLEKELKVGVVFIDSEKQGKTTVEFEEIVMNNLQKNNRYTFKQLEKTGFSRDDEQDKEFKEFLKNQYQDKIRLIIFISRTNSLKKVAIDEIGKGDIADLIQMKITSRVYSTKNGKLYGSFENDFENTSIAEPKIDKINNENSTRYSRMLIPELIQLGAM